ncbi:AAA family ATPase [Mucilaginibacter sp. UC70_90]
MPETCPIIAFTAGKGGCGKTTLAINFAYNILKAHKKVLVVDFDLSNRGSSGVFSNYINKTNQNNFTTLTDILLPASEASKTTYPLITINDKGYLFLPASHTGEDVKSEIYEQRSLTDIVNQVKTKLNEIAIANRLTV